MLRSRVVGLYGISGSGKSHALAKLRESRPEWRCMEGSDILKSVLSKREMLFKTFQSLSTDGEDRLLAHEIRNEAVGEIRKLTGISVVAGHASFPVLQGDQIIGFRDIFTNGDAETYDFIFFLETDTNVVLQQRSADNSSDKRTRASMSIEALEQWTSHEKAVLKCECDANNIPFEIINNVKELESVIVSHVLMPAVREAQLKSEQELCKAVHKTIPASDIYLLIDADRTLCPEDTGKLFFESSKLQIYNKNGLDPLKSIFKRYPNYTFQAFLEVAMLYEKVLQVSEYELLCKEIANTEINLYPAWITFLSNLPSSVHPVIVSSGIRDVWLEALNKYGLLSANDEGETNKMSVIAGNHLSRHQYIVDSGAKGIVVEALRQKVGGCKILSFGDSVIDILMLQSSDRGYIIIDDRRNRSLHGFIKEVSASDGCQQMYQLFPGDELPVASWHCGLKMGSLSTLIEELESGAIHGVLAFDSKGSAASLATQSRQADLSGPSLQAVHYEIGKYLADRLLDAFPSNLMTVGEFTHVQKGSKFSGKMTSHKVLILPLMRGGEPMARGVFERFPKAQLYHIWDEKKYDAEKTVEEELVRLLKSTNDVVIVDSVINEGHSIRKLLGYLHGLFSHETVRFYVLTAVMQKQASLKLPKEFPRVSFITLRVSDNQYKGKGGTDTGNRLFGTF